MKLRLDSSVYMLLERDFLSTNAAVRRMGEEKVMKKVTEWKSDFRRVRGRPKRRWEEQVLEDINRLGIRN